jgi:hypothetical protein
MRPQHRHRQRVEHLKCWLGLERQPVILERQRPNPLPRGRKDRIAHRRHDRRLPRLPTRPRTHPSAQAPPPSLAVAKAAASARRSRSGHSKALSLAALGKKCRRNGVTEETGSDSPSSPRSAMRCARLLAKPIRRPARYVATSSTFVQCHQERAYETTV